MTNTEPTDRLRRYGTRIQTAFIDEATEIATRSASKTPSGLQSTSRVLGKVAAVLLAGVVGVGSLGIAADASVPGQLLYPIDRSTERVLASLGLSTADQRLAERTHEAQVLLDREQPADALDTLVGALSAEFDQLTPEEAAEHGEAIMETAERAAAVGDPSEIGALEDMVSDVRDHIRAGEADSPPPGAVDRNDVGAGGGDE